MNDYLIRKNLIFNYNIEPGIYFDRNKYKKWFENVVERWIPNKLHLITLIYGDNNAGKTHFLKYINWNLLQNEFIEIVEYIDLQKVSSEYDFYSRIIEALIKCGFLNDFLIDVVSKENQLKIKKTTGGIILSTISSALSYNPEPIKLYIQGKLDEFKTLGLSDIKKDVFISTAIISELLRALYFLNNRIYPYLLIDHLESLIGDPPRSYMSKFQKEESIKILRTIIERSCIIMTLDYNSLWSFKDYFPKFNISTFDEFNFNKIYDYDISDLIKELNTYIVDRERISNIDIQSYQEENVSREYYPLTNEGYNFILKLKSQPGIILNVLNASLTKALEKTGIEIITKKMIEESIQKLYPQIMVMCNSCNLSLHQLNIHIHTTHRGPSYILDVKCPLCGKSITKLAPLLLDRIVPDTSALVEKSITALFQKFPELGVVNQVNIYIPKAVRSEIAALEKRREKFQASRNAIYELKNILKLAKRKYVYIEQNVGRSPTRNEIRLAQKSDSIDKIIMEIAEKYDATLVTGDNFLADNYGSLGNFSFYIIQESKDEREINKSRQRRGRRWNR